MEKRSAAAKPRLLIILNRFVIGGQAVDTIPLAWHLQQQFEVMIMYGEKEKDEVEPIFLLDKYPGLTLKKMKRLRRSINPLNDGLALLQVYYVIRRFKADIVHTHGAKSGFAGRLAAWLCRVPVIIHTFHGHFFHSYFSASGSRLIAKVERAIGKITTAAVALSPAQKNDLANVYHILPASKINIIPLGFSFDQTNLPGEQRMLFREKYGLREDDVAIGIVGRIVPVKNHFLFVKAVANLLQSNPRLPAAFFVVGDGILKKEVMEAFASANVAYSESRVTPECRVVFTSWITDMYEVMNGLDVVALTSHNEGTPLSIIEAQFFKKPIISTDAGGVRDTMQDNRGGFIVAQNDVEAFAGRMLQLINNAGMRHQMGEAGYEFAREKFSKEKEIGAMSAFYFDQLRQAKGL